MPAITTTHPQCHLCGVDEHIPRDLQSLYLLLLQSPLLMARQKVLTESKSLVDLVIIQIHRDYFDVDGLLV